MLTRKLIFSRLSCFSAEPTATPNVVADELRLAVRSIGCV
jgi:hypothetical protein